MMHECFQKNTDYPNLQHQILTLSVKANTGYCEPNKTSRWLNTISRESYNNVSLRFGKYFQEARKIGSVVTGGEIFQ